ncbi:predicted protein [Arabidopsis lyrata subsp. lyrata]|uniref:Predicted protein n=1 Tax=Arabidopsis lyrata subsp. lyrata TaxID=81972 RepID=D7L713_ARALL|nr:predicted protein [Arabidopsis lyrata subsp. lyrata]
MIFVQRLLVTKRSRWDFSIGYLFDFYLSSWDIALQKLREIYGESTEIHDLRDEMWSGLGKSVCSRGENIWSYLSDNAARKWDVDCILDIQIAQLKQADIFQKVEEENPQIDEEEIIKKTGGSWFSWKISSSED